MTIVHGMLLPLIAVVAIAANPPATELNDCDEEAGVTALFDGETLAGWTKVGTNGTAEYRVEDGCIVGIAGSSHNTFLRTEKEYADFELRLEFRWVDPTNSGIQFRSHLNDAGYVYGYQCEIDPSDRAWTGGLYDEGRRGWLDPLDDQPEAQKAVRLDDWNELRIRAVGDHLQTWLNGVACADLHDDKDSTGFIALQVHSGGKGQIRWRNIRIKEVQTESRKQTTESR